jgi:DNA-binding transcriptional regulator LsrR (DeoR family)
MPAKRELTMRQLRYKLRLHHDGVSAREIGRTLGVARSTIQDNLRRAHAIGIAWPVPAELTDDMLEQRLFARAGVKVLSKLITVKCPIGAKLLFQVLV